MDLMGYPWMVTLKVINHTDKEIDLIEFFYNYQESISGLKNIKVNESKQTSICTLYDVKDLRMYIEICNKYFTIKKYIQRGYKDTLIIDILSIDKDNCKFCISKEE